MGWASYFEDICQKYQDPVEECIRLPGPPRDPGYRRQRTKANRAAKPPLRKLKRSIPQSLAKRYEALESVYDRFSPSVLDAFAYENWKTLSSKMDRLEAESIEIGRKVLFASIEKRDLETGKLLREIRAVLFRGRGIIERHDRAIGQIQNAYAAMQSELARLDFPLADPSNPVESLLKGWHALRNQCDVLRERAERLEESVEIQAAEDLMPRLIDGLQYIVPDKD